MALAMIALRTAKAMKIGTGTGGESRCWRALDMCQTCKYVIGMSKMIQVRHVPDPLHRKLKARAAMEGLSLSDYLLREIRQIADKPTLTELRERLSSRAPVVVRISPVQVLREERGRR